MSDPREALTRLLMSWGVDDESAGLCAGQILDEFLVVPRSDITGIEYGYRHRLPSGRTCEHPACTREEAIEFAREYGGGIAEALERAALSWTPIPLEAVPDAS